MASKKDVSRLLRKKLTGMEAARLMIEDSWEVDHRREGILSRADMQRLKGGLYGREAEEYNKWIRVYQLVDYSLKDARIYALEAQKWMLLATRELQVYRLEDMTRGILLFVPAIVTQKQYEELRAMQKERQLQDSLLWEAVLAMGSMALAPADVLEETRKLELEEWEDGTAYDNGYLLREHHPEYWQQATEKLLELIREGRLHPVLLQSKDIARLERMQKRSQAYRERRYPPVQTRDELKAQEQAGYPPGWTQKDERAWDKLLEQANSLQDEAKKRASPLDAARLEQILASEEQSSLLEWTYFSTRELYESSLSKWVGWVDTYIPGLDEETSARPAGMMQSSSVAIIQEPDADELDERGWYKDKGAELLTILSGYDREDRRTEKRGFSTPEFLETAHKQAKDRIKIFLAIQAVVEAISDIIGVPMLEDLEDWYDDIQLHVNHYNGYLTPKSEWVRPPYYLGMPELKGLKIGKLKPTARSLQYYRERMAMALGDDWWKEAMESLDLRATEPGSLAEEAGQELQEELASREAKNGQE